MAWRKSRGSTSPRKLPTPRGCTQQVPMRCLAIISLKGPEFPQGRIRKEKGMAVLVFAEK